MLQNIYNTIIVLVLIILISRISMLSRNQKILADKLNVKTYEIGVFDDLLDSTNKFYKVMP